jgi:hypothetical protein
MGAVSVKRYLPICLSKVTPRDNAPCLTICPEKIMNSLSTVTLGEHFNIGWLVDFFPAGSRFSENKIQNQITTGSN